MTPVRRFFPSFLLDFVLSQRQLDAPCQNMKEPNDKESPNRGRDKGPGKKNKGEEINKKSTRKSERVKENRKRKEIISTCYLSFIHSFLFTRGLLHHHALESVAAAHRGFLCRLVGRAVDLLRSPLHHQG